MTNVSAYAFGLPEIILLFAVLQTLLLALVLLATPGRTPVPNRLLSAFLLGLALVLTEFVLIKGGVTLLRPHLLGISLPGYLIVAPLYYLYARTLTDGRLEGRDAWHLLPVLVGIMASVPFYLFPAESKRALLVQLAGDGFSAFPLAPVLMISLLSFQMIVYFYRAYAFLEEYEAAAREESASTSIMAANWLKKLSFAFCLFVLIFYLAAAELFFLYPYRGVALSPDVFRFCIAAFIFLVSWHMYRHPELFALYTPGVLPQAEPGSDRLKYEKTMLPPEQLAEYEKRLLGYMAQEQPYLDGELRLSQLAAGLHMPVHHLSQAINVSQGQSFFDFINQHRVNHAKALLLAWGPEGNMLDVALDAGFNSKASFNRVFKKVTGVTPSAFQRQHKNSKTGEYLAR